MLLFPSWFFKLERSDSFWVWFVWRFIICSTKFIINLILVLFYTILVDISKIPRVHSYIPRNCNNLFSCTGGILLKIHIDSSLNFTDGILLKIHFWEVLTGLPQLKNLFIIIKWLNARSIFLNLYNSCIRLNPIIQYVQAPSCN